ncbi:hypothetical protein CHL78_019065 [Romboutsia weinsteinii]|uniref:Uncharacterized protein n=1 Tax=Romboutsia weinsteinii TaxID=2020949 RepID=A0A371IXQ2_9FIRM|nr:hypothetical protein [Romboutsia weinsteinii]RDY25263.1 hypothetical protein CHL78_019065 [Romboutsia weinsteinii]
MNILDLTNKLEKGKNLGGEIVYIKEENIIYGIDSVYKDQEEQSVTVLRSKDDTIKVDHFLTLLNEIYANLGDKEVLIGSKEYTRDSVREITSIEFAQYESSKMLFINI